MSKGVRTDLLVVSAYIAPPDGGIQRLAMEIADAFPEQRVRIVGVSSQPSSDPRIRVVRMRPGKVGSAITLVAFAAVTIQELRRRPRVLHAMTWRAAVPLLAFKHTPTVLYCHGAELVRAFKGGPEVALRRRVLRHMTGIVANSRFTVGLVRDVGERNARIIHPALPFAPVFVDRSERSNTEISILSVGRMFPDKGFDRLIDAAALLRTQGRELTVTIVGDGPHRGELQEQIDRLGLGDVVRLTGRITDDELRALYEQADVFALLSRPFNDEVEGFGIVYIEAGAYGLPVVAGNCGGIPDAVAEGESGFLTSTVEDAAAALARLADDPALRHQLGEQGRQRAVELFSPAAFRAELEAFYDDAVAAWQAKSKL